MNLSISNIMPELVLVLVAIFVLLSDLFSGLRNSKAAMRQRVNDGSSLALLGLGIAFVFVLVQSNFVFADKLTGIGYIDSFIGNLRAGGQPVELLGGAFVISPLTHLARLLFIGAAFTTIMLTRATPPSSNPGEYYALIMISTLGMIIMSGAGELMLLYLGLELTSIPLYILAGYYRRSKVSVEAGVKYYIFGALSSAILLFGMSLVLGMAMIYTPQTGDVTGVPSTFKAIAGAVQQAFAAGADPAGQTVLLLGMVFMIAGMAYKIAIVPFHAWSPDVYEGAPTTMTAFISTASKTAGFLLLFRLLTVAFGAPETMGSAALPQDSLFGLSFGGWSLLLAIVAAFTMLLGNLAALPQTNVKRLLAYSSIAHAGFLLLGLMGNDRSSGTALLYYLVVYTITNLGAFGVLALMEESTGGTDLSDLNGMGRRAPGLTLLLTICVLSLAGIPPLSGFFVKFYIFIAAWQTGAKWLVIFAVANTVISLYYYLQILRAMYIREPKETTPIKTAPGAYAFMVLAVLLVIGLGILQPSVFDTIQQAAVNLVARQ